MRLEADPLPGERLLQLQLLLMHENPCVQPPANWVSWTTHVWNAPAIVCLTLGTQTRRQGLMAQQNHMTMTPGLANGFKSQEQGSECEQMAFQRPEMGAKVAAKAPVGVEKRPKGLVTLSGSTYSVPVHQFGKFDPLRDPD
mmetsp:Transcript_71755/g.126351  ORF Transcript_71755/g.126351 Transcript_71755/m.126351 type:complete len:141 (+) Transcript_71755:85-507(+)